MVIVDSSVLIDHLKNAQTPHALWIRRNRELETIGIPSLVVCEVLQGIRGQTRFIQAVTELTRFQIFELASFSLAHSSAMNYRTLRGLGFTVRTTIDCLIATFCIEEGYPLLHNDRDFDAFERHLKLKVLHPPESLLQ